jgi:hypothetical protein
MTIAHKKSVSRKRTPELCQRCGSRIPPVARKHGDPFCSRVCAEATYGTQPGSTPVSPLLSGLRRGAHGADHRRLLPRIHRHQTSAGV